MNNSKIAVFGASGFVGAALCERLYFENKFDFTALIHGYANALRIARLPVEIKTVDLIKYKEVYNSLAGCDVIVNCSRGNSEVMIKGLRNLTKAARERKIKKFIHIGSLAIYGDYPSASAENEIAKPNPGKNAYGMLKVKQDDMIFKLHESAIPSIILSPGNISGPYSPFIIDAVDKLLAGEVVLVENGDNPANLVHIDNLVESILTAIRSDIGWGERYFINDTDKITWKELYEDLAKMFGVDYEFRPVSAEEVIRSLERKKGGNLIGDIINIVNIVKTEEFLNILKSMPSALKLYSRLGPYMQRKIKANLKAGIKSRVNVHEDLSQHFIKVQIRKVYFSSQKIIDELNYRPILDYREGMETMRSWFEFANIGNHCPKFNGEHV